LLHGNSGRSECNQGWIDCGHSRPIRLGGLTVRRLWIALTALTERAGGGPRRHLARL